VSHYVGQAGLKLSILPLQVAPSQPALFYLTLSNLNLNVYIHFVAVILDSIAIEE
jgi:hypothetical protein